MLKLLFSCLVLLVFNACRAQSKNLRAAKDSNTTFVLTESQAFFPAGDSVLKKFISSNFRIPDTLVIKGRIVASFSIERDGSVSDIQIVKSLHPDLDKEWVRVLGLMPKWTPAMQNGTVVKTRWKLPITVDIPGE